MSNKNRTELKAYFVKNAIPTEANFIDLIDSQLNQTEDGLFKMSGEALAVVSAGGDQKRVLRLFANYPAANPDWQISLNPAQDPAHPATSRPGFGIVDGAGKPRLFIDAPTGRIGVGTNDPKVQLDVRGDASIDGVLRLNDKPAYLRAGADTNHGLGWYDKYGGVAVDGPVAFGWSGGALGTTNGGPKTVINWTKDTIQLRGTRLSNLQGLGIVETNATDWLRINPDSSFPAIALYKPVAIGTGGLSIGDWNQIPAGQLRVTGDSTLLGAVRVGGNLTLTSARLNNASGLGILQTNATDWLRINPDEAFPSIALYKPVAIGSGGLAIGDWSQLPQGQLRATGRATLLAGAQIREMGIGTETHGHTDYPYETIQMTPGTNLRVWYGQKQRFVLENNGQLRILLDGGYWLFQVDGNLVKYNNAGTAVWGLQKAGGGPGWG